MKIDYNIDFENKRTYCTLTLKDKKFVGEAICHDTDKDFYSEMTGRSIAYTRACIKYFQFLKNEERTKLHALYDLRAHLKPEEHCKTIDKTIKQHEEFLEDLVEAISYHREYLYSYINEKDKVYKKLRGAKND